ncbi:MAG: prolipoprotein diacylglyceryl transferase family protein [Bdellovibrionota bacterium]
MFPILYQNNGFFLYSYPLFMGLGWGLAYQVLFELLPAEFTRIRAQILFWGMFCFAWIGAKSLFLFTVPQELSLSLVNESSFWLGGGFVFYGGLLGGLLYLLILKGLKFPVNKEIVWSMVPALTLGHAVGRFGCFLAGCCYGKETDFFWGIHLHGADRHPTQLLEFFLLLGLSVYLLKSKRKQIDLICVYLVAYGFIRLFMESLRGDLIRGYWGWLTPSQWISCLLIAAGAFIFVRENEYLKRLD